MEARDFLYFVFMIASIIGICKYKLSKKSLLFVAFAGIQSYLYWDTNKINSFMSKDSLAHTNESFFMPNFSDLLIIFFIVSLSIFVIFYFFSSSTTSIKNDKKILTEYKNDYPFKRVYQKPKSYKRNNESVGDVVWGVTWRAIAYAITGLWFWKAK